MAYFPIFTQIEGKRCFIIGGGKVAARKVHTLLQYGADVIVAAQKVCEEIKESLPEKNVFEGAFEYAYENIHENRYLDLKISGNSIGGSSTECQKDLSENLLNDFPENMQKDFLESRKEIFLKKEIHKAFLVIAATSNREENHHIAELCHACNVLVNVADSEEESSFIFPSIVRKGNISIGINSGTGSPAVSKHIRKQIEKAVPDYYADIAVFMGELRQYVKANFKEEAQRRYILKTAAATAFSEERVLTEKEIEEIIRQGQK